MLFAFMDAFQEIKIRNARWQSGSPSRIVPTADDSLRRDEKQRKTLAEKLIANGVDREEAYKRCGLA